MSKSQNPAYPDADPTAPGGMSQKALVKELVEQHGFDPSVADESWPALILAVIDSRQRREQEQTDAEVMTEAHIEAASADTTPPLFIGMPDSMDYRFDNHAGAGPSGAERWMNCTASLGAARAFLETLTPNQQREFAGAGSAARQGTTAHAAAETEALVLLGRMDQHEAEQVMLELSIMPETEDEAYDQEMAEYITEYTDLIQSYSNERGPGAIMVEQVVEALIPLMTVDSEGEQNLHAIRGSADLIVLPTESEPTLVVGDLKYGNGIDVDVEQNPQIRIYALGVLGLLADEDTGEMPEWLNTVTYHIIQPRLGGIKTWTESIDDLLDWRDDVLSPALTEALGGRKAGAKFTPGELQCQWCPARGTCAALAEQRIEQAAHLFDTIQDAEFADGPGAFPETGSLTDTRLGELMTQINGLIKIKDDLKSEVERRLFRGGSVPGWQLVNYTPPRKWKPEAARELDQDASLWVKKLVTPAVAVKTMTEDLDRVMDLIDTPDKRPVVAPEGDRRKTWDGKAPESMFEIEGDK